VEFSPEILNKIKKGHPGAQRLLYDAFKMELFNVCRRYSSDEATAKDMFQEGFIKIFKDFHQFNIQRGTVRSWVRKVMVNAALQHIRSNKKWNGTLEINALPNHDLSYRDNILDTLSMEEIQKLIVQMPDGYKMVFNMYLIEGFSHKEIAQMLDITESTSKSQLYKSKQWMRNKLVELDPGLLKEYGRQVAQG
jgi:RNA polymerase sigma-70 factor (ECF subfamily)